MKQRIAGYVIDKYYQRRKDSKTNGESLFNPARDLCWFDMIGIPDEKAKSSFQSEIAVAINLLQRGFPTRLNLGSLERLIESNRYLSLNSTNDFDFFADYINENIFFHKEQLLHFIDPRINKGYLENHRNALSQKMDSSLERTFYFEILPAFLGARDEFLLQLIIPQKKISDLVEPQDDNKNLDKGIIQKFFNQRIDFLIELPYPNNKGIKGIAIEIDGEHHKSPTQIHLDNERDNALLQLNYGQTIRITSEDFRHNRVFEKLNPLLDFIDSSPYLKNLKQTYQSYELNNPETPELFEMAFTPFAIARIQLVILELIKNGQLDLKNEKWKIGVLEHDVPCAHLAIDDLKDLLENIYTFYNPDKSFKFPVVELEVFSSEEFIHSRLHQLNSGKPKPIQNIDKSKRFDVFIDVSVLKRSGFFDYENQNANYNIEIRSSTHCFAKRTIVSAKPLKTKNFAVKERGKTDYITEEWAEKSLTYFLKSIFRNKAFLPGQLPILNKALQWENVIGLLPTGGGKSLTYQLATLLQPGISMVIDPINSLMWDQIDGLEKHLIDSTEFVNSTIKDPKERQRRLESIANGSYQFVFFSPERLMIQDFRDKLKQMGKAGHYFAYCVIDEAHCVSEWGHDFRTPYLLLGQNARSFCPTKTGDFVPLIALTATASFDVLSDIQRELSGKEVNERLDADTIISFDTIKRHELQFRVEKVRVEKNSFPDIWGIREAFGKAKQKRIAELLKNIPYHLSEFNDNLDLVLESNNGQIAEKAILKNFDEHTFFLPDANLNQFNHSGLIFMPHRSGWYGVKNAKPDNDDKKEIFDNIDDYVKEIDRQIRIDKGYFMGGDLNDNQADINLKNQKAFKEDKLNLMIATKAFGMGIDKKNIRYTIHFNYPQSIEGFVQEAGRAGRDREMAISYVLFNEQKVILEKDNRKVEPDFEINSFFHNNSFKGEKKELAILDELLHQIISADKTNEIEAEINERLNREISIAYWTKDDFKGIFFNTELQEKLGFINLYNLNAKPKESVDLDLSKQVFEISQNYITSNCPDNNYGKWILGSSTLSCLENEINRAGNNKPFSLLIPFQNNITERSEKLAHWLNKALHKFFDNTKITKAYSYSQNFAEFVKNIEDEYKKFTRNEGKSSLKELLEKDDIRYKKPKGEAYSRFEKYYNGYRTDEDTAKAIYRLLLIGAIDDYTIDYRSRTYTVYGIKRTPGEYKNRVKQYLKTYFGENRVMQEMQKLKNTPGKSEIETCLKYVVGFIYDTIADKRAKGIEAMKSACKYYLESPKEKRNIRFKEYLDLYFNSKYARDDYTIATEKGDEGASLKRFLNEKEKIKGIDVIWHFTKILKTDGSGSEIENAKHLRGACLRLESEIVADFRVLVLHAFAIYFLESQNPNILNIAEERLSDGFAQYSKIVNDDIAKLKGLYEKFRNELSNFNKNIHNELEKAGYPIEFDKVTLHQYLPLLENLSHHLGAFNNKLQS